MVTKQEHMRQHFEKELKLDRIAQAEKPKIDVHVKITPLYKEQRKKYELEKQNFIMLTYSLLNTETKKEKQGIFNPIFV